MNANPGSYSLLFTRGATLLRYFITKDKAGVVVPIPTGWQPRGQIRTNAARFGTSATESLLMDLTVANGRLTIEDAAAGKLKLLLSSEDTIELCPSNIRTKLAWGCELFDDSDPKQVSKLLQGDVIIQPEVPR